MQMVEMRIFVIQLKHVYKGRQAMNPKPLKKSKIPITKGRLLL